jgi:hypothetical protein
MTTYKEPVSNQYACSKYGKTVTISWIMVSIPGGGPSAPSKYRCSGMPDCGQRLGQPPCPYPNS